VLHGQKPRVKRSYCRQRMARFYGQCVTAECQKAVRPSSPFDLWFCQSDSTGHGEFFENNGEVEFRRYAKKYPYANHTQIKVLMGLHPRV